jgi:hypothetical protein
MNATVQQKSDEELTTRVFHERDMLVGEVFRRVYGIDAEKYIERYRREKVLPVQVREFCEELLAGRASRWPER